MCHATHFFGLPYWFRTLEWLRASWFKYLLLVTADNLNINLNVFLTIDSRWVSPSVLRNLWLNLISHCIFSIYLIWNTVMLRLDPVTLPCICVCCYSPFFVGDFFQLHSFYSMLLDMHYLIWSHIIGVSKCLSSIYLLARLSYFALFPDSDDIQTTPMHYLRAALVAVKECIKPVKIHFRQCRKHRSTGAVSVQGKKVERRKIISRSSIKLIAWSNRWWWTSKAEDHFVRFHNVLY